jgi:hypothetical protein
MPEPETYSPHRPIRIDGELWDQLGDAVGERKRSALVRDLVRWWLRVPGAALPARPDQPSRRTSAA